MARREVDGCVVATAALAPVLEEFVTNWRRTRRSRRGQWGPGEERIGDVDPMTPLQWLAFDTGIPEPHIRRVTKPERHPLTELHVADALVASIGHPGMFHGDEPQLRILPNPNAPRERQSECCGGSERHR